MNDLDGFYASMLMDVRSSSVGMNEYPRDTFTEWALQKLDEANEVMDLIQAPFQGVAKRGKKLAIDAFGFDSVDGSYVALITDFHDEDELSTLTRSEIDGLFNSLRAFLENCADINEFRNFPNYEESVAAGQLLLENRGSISKFKLILVSNRTLSTRVKQLDSENLDGKPVNLYVWDLNRFFDAFSSSQGREEISIDMRTWYPEGLPALPAPSETDELLGVYLAIISGAALAQIFDNYGSRLLEGNVRSFLSARGAVNKGIRQTLLGSPEKFLSYNNGITATATEIECEVMGPTVLITRISDLQIVNGGQTTASLHDFLKKEKDSQNLFNANVQMKLLVVRPEASDEMVPLIARYSNSQNKVSEADFFSNSSFHRKFEELSKRLIANPRGGSQISTYWFYERARGSFANERSRTGNLNQFDLKYPKSQLITKTDLAKYHNSWAQLPHQVSAGAQKNFLSFASQVADAYASNELSFGERYFKQIVSQAILFKSLHRLVMKQDWYAGYAANIVTYGLARVSFELKQKNLDLDWDLIWRTQDISDQFLSVLLDSGKKMLEVLTSETRPKQNVTEWAKDAECWKRAKNATLDIDFSVIPEVREYDAEATRAEIKEDRLNNLAVNEAVMMTFLIGLGPHFWREMASNPPGRLRISPNEASAMKKITNQGVLSSDREYALLYSLLLRAREEGLNLPGFPSA